VSVCDPDQSDFFIIEGMSLCDTVGDRKVTLLLLQWTVTKGAQMAKEAFFHDWLVSHLQGRLARDYKDITANIGEDRKHEFNGHYPDLILANQGMVLAIMEVETEESITAEKAGRWKELAGLGAKLILMVPNHTRPKVMDLVLQKGLAGKVGVASYEITVKM
jgi:hypothetical protein